MMSGGMGPMNGIQPTIQQGMLGNFDPSSFSPQSQNIPNYSQFYGFNPMQTGMGMPPAGPFPSGQMPYSPMMAGQSFGQMMSPMSSMPSQGMMTMPSMGGNGFNRPLGGGLFQNDMANSVGARDKSTATRIIPPFLKSATQQQQDEFYEIVQNPIWSPSEKQRRIELFVRNLSTVQQEAYSQFQQSSSSDSEAKRQKVHQIVDEMSPEAQIQFQKVSAVMTNPALSEKERLSKVQQLYGSISDKIKKEFDEKLVGF